MSSIWKLSMTAAALAIPSSAVAHGESPASGRDLWWQWSRDPWVLVPLAMLAILHAAGSLRLRQESSAAGRRARRAENASFWLGWLSLVIALASPLHPLGELLFSAHMTQHEVLMLVSAPLLVLSRPLPAMLWALPRGTRLAVADIARLRAVQTIWRMLTLPLAAWLVHAVALWVWHVPALFEATLRSDAVHTLQHASFFGSALLFWWALVHGPRGLAGYGAAVLYVFTTSVHSGALGALLTFARTVWYPSYVATAPEWGLSAIEDQQLGGLIMWVPAALVYLFAAMAMMVAWLRQSERRARSAPLVPSLALALLPLIGACNSGHHSNVTVGGGNPELGAAAIQRYGCATCHAIPGIRGASGLVGPPLDHIASRVYLAGRITNTPANLRRWIQHPRSIDEKTAMPDLGVTDADAADIASYLLTLK